MSLYIEITIRADMDELWKRTQTPDLHGRWDLRFSEITYLSRPDARQPQRFLYKTRLGFGLEIAGEGETVGEQNGAQGCRTSALKFWSDDPRSLIRAGSGYWQYEPVAEGIRFRTRYDYRTRFGWFGKGIDRLLFRPLMGWATAWSFDRLRLWLEQGITPEISLRSSLMHALARLTLAFIWTVEGLLSNLLLRHTGELITMNLAMLALAVLQTRAMPALPSARHCRRKPEEQ